MKLLTHLLLLGLAVLIGTAPSIAQNKRPCDILTSAEARAIAGVPVELSADDSDHCSYNQVGYGDKAPNNRSVWLGIYRHSSANANDVLDRRNAFKAYMPPPDKVQNISDVGDAAMWIWRGDQGGYFYAYKAGIVEVEAGITGLPPDKALGAARDLAVKALGGAAGTGFAYAGAPPPRHATNFPFFDKLPAEFQALYVADMTDATIRALQDGGDGDAAHKVEQLMTNISPGSQIPLGIAEFEGNEARARVFDLERQVKDPHARRLDVADALFVTLKKNNIPLSNSEIDSVMDTLAQWRPMTYAQFDAMDATAQRHYIAMLVAIAYPDLELRMQVKNRIAEKNHQAKEDAVVDDAGLMKRERELIAQEFPVGATNQPGFAALAKKIHARAIEKPADPGVFYTVHVHILEMLDEDNTRQMKEMEERTLHLPN